VRSYYNVKYCTFIPPTCRLGIVCPRVLTINNGNSFQTSSAILFIVTVDIAARFN